jgi:penicillin-binding protein 1A
MTIGNNGDRVSGTLAPRPGDSPVAFTQVTDKDDHTIKGGDNDSTHEQVFSEDTAVEAKGILETVVSSGTGTHAQIGAEGQWGKTGTTENNGDAWFCGGISDEVTACVWVGYPDSTTPMTTLYNGGPVMGGTYPALIWASVLSAWDEIKAGRSAQKENVSPSTGGGTEYVSPAEPSSTEAAPEVESEAAAPPDNEEQAGSAAAPSEPAEVSPESSGGVGVAPG